MKLLGMSAMVVAVFAAAPAMAADHSDAYIGEVRIFAVARGDRDAVADLQRATWVEANGSVGSGTSSEER